MPLDRSIRRTIHRPVTITGTALFTGADASVTIKRGESGIRFVTPSGQANATIENLSDLPVHPVFASLKPRCTSIQISETAIATVEHLMAALAALGITDATIETAAPELPVLDGSAAQFAGSLLSAGIVETPGQAAVITITEPVVLRDGDATLTAEPSDTIDYAYACDYGDNSPVPPGTASWQGDPDAFMEHIAPARTFSTQSEAEQMKSLGLFGSFSPKDLLVLGPDGPIENRLRFADEPARHKLLDLIGDLALLGAPLIARVRAHKTGHAHTHALCRRIRAQQ